MDFNGSDMRANTYFYFWLFFCNENKMVKDIQTHTTTNNNRWRKSIFDWLICFVSHDRKISIILCHFWTKATLSKANIPYWIRTSHEALSFSLIYFFSIPFSSSMLKVHAVLRFIFIVSITLNIGARNSIWKLVDFYYHNWIYTFTFSLHLPYRFCPSFRSPFAIRLAWYANWSHRSWLSTICRMTNQCSINTKKNKTSFSCHSCRPTRRSPSHSSNICEQFSIEIKEKTFFFCVYARTKASTNLFWLFAVSAELRSTGKVLVLRK